jgi:GDPmannose 4,6-dehydratase
VIATGFQYSVREFIEIAAKHLGIYLEWQGSGIDEKGYNTQTKKCVVKVDPKYFRPTEVETLLGDPTKAKKKLGWQPCISFDKLVEEMIVEDLKLAERDTLCQRQGFKTL